MARYENVVDVWRQDETGNTVAEFAKDIDSKEYADLGIMVETRIPPHFDDDIFKNNLLGYSVKRASLVNQNITIKNSGGGLLLYFREETVQVENLVVRNDIEQIYCEIISKKDPDLRFTLCAFYIRPKPPIGPFQLKESGIEWQMTQSQWFVLAFGLYWGYKCKYCDRYQ